MNYTWKKKLSKSDAQEKTRGGNMPFLRLTKGNLKDADYKKWFREIFFGSLSWSKERNRKGEQKEIAEVEISVNIMNEDLGRQKMIVEHCQVG